MADTSRSKADFNVYLDGTKLDGATKAAISGVRVYLTHSGASAFEIVVDDPELRWQDKPTFTECREVKIELGIPGKMKKVFDGEVTAWRTELERSGPTVLVLRGLDRSHRLMRGHKTKTYAEASPIDCAQQIASAAGLSAKTSAGQPAPVKTYRIQANESDFNFLRKMADLEGYLFYVDGSDLHFERPTLSSNDDVTVTYGEDLKTFLPVANFRRPAAKVEVGAWDSGGKAALTGKAKPGDELWSVPGGKPGADVAKFQGTKASLGIVESQVATQEHADTVAKAALTKRSLEFLTAEVEVQGNPEIKPGAMVNVKKVGVYSGHYLVTEANHFFDAGGYSCIFYVARDKWGDSSTDAEKKRSAEEERKKGKERAEQPYKPPKPPPGKPPADDTIDFTLEWDDGKPLKNVKCKVKLKSGEVIEATTDADGHVHIDEKPEGPYTVEITGDALELTSIDIAVEDVEGAPVAGASGKVKLSDGAEIAVTTDAEGNVHLEDVPKGEYTFTLDAPAAGGEAPAGDGATDGGSAPGGAGAGGATAGGGAAPGQGAPAGGAGGAGGTAAPGGASAGGAAPSAGAAPTGPGAKLGPTTPGAGAAAGGATGPVGGKEIGPATGRGHATAGGAVSPGPAGADAGAGGKTGAGSPAPGTPGKAPGPAQTGAADPKSAAGSATSGAGSAPAPATGAAATRAGPATVAPPAAAPTAAAVPRAAAPPPAPTPSGGAPTAGTAPASPAPAPTPSGGAPAGGTAPASPAPAPTPSGGAPAGGTAPASPAPAPTVSGGAPTAGTAPASPAPAPTVSGGAPAGGAAPVSPPPAPGTSGAAASASAATVSSGPGAPSGAPSPGARAGVAPAGNSTPAAPAGPAAPGGRGGATAPEGEGLSPAEIGGIGAGVAAVGAVSAGVASAAEGAEAVKDAAESAAEGAKVPDSENVEE